MTQVFIHSFIKRQTADSRFSHTEKTFEDLAYEVITNMDKARQSAFQPRALEVPVNPSHCRTGIVNLVENDDMVAYFEIRREGEAPRKTLCAHWGAVGPEQKVPAKSAYVVLFPSTLLAEDGQNEHEPVDGNWEMISLNASPTLNDTPIDPDTLMHNHFGSQGGTPTGLSDEEFVKVLRESFTFWKDKAMLGGV